MRNEKILSLGINLKNLFSERKSKFVQQGCGKIS